MSTCRTDAKEAEVTARQAYDDARTQQEAEAAEAAIKAAVAEMAAAQAAQEPDQPVEKPVDPDELPMFFQAWTALPFASPLLAMQLHQTQGLMHCVLWTLGAACHRCQPTMYISTVAAAAAAAAG